MNAFMNPRADGRIARNSRHKGIPVISELVQIATLKVIGVTKPQPSKIGGCSTRQDVSRRRKTIERRRRRCFAAQINPGGRKDLADDGRRIKTFNEDLGTAIATQKIKREILRRDRGTDIRSKERPTDQNRGKARLQRLLYIQKYLMLILLYGCKYCHSIGHINWCFK